MSDVLTLVRNAHLGGATTRKEICVVTSLDADIVDLCVDLLIKNGEINLTAIKGACTIGGCSSCGEDQSCTPRENIGGKVFTDLQFPKKKK